MSDEKLTPERVVRLLRAKGAELEHRVLIEGDSLGEPMTTLGMNMMVIGMMADIALIAQLLADHIEASIPVRMIDIEDYPIVTKTGKVLTDDDIQALADEAEAGYDVKVWDAKKMRWVRDD